MVCKKCGKYSPDYCDACKYCGAPLQKSAEKVNAYTYNMGPVSKKTASGGVEDVGSDCNTLGFAKDRLGFWLGILMGLWALIVAFCAYKKGSYERQTFLQGFWKAVIVLLIVGVVLGLILGLAIGSMAYA